MKPFWCFIHNCIIHPVMGVIELVTWNNYMPEWLLQWHDHTAKKAGFEP